jgi:hypothetical protein
MYKNQMFKTVYTTARHLIPPYPKPREYSLHLLPYFLKRLPQLSSLIYAKDSETL